MAINSNKPVNVKTEGAEGFYFTFIQMFKQQLQIKHMADVHVLTKFCLLMQYNSTRVSLTTGLRKQLCADIQIKTTHLSNSIARLKSIGIIIGEDGEYEVNPFFAWKGTLAERDRLLATSGVDIKVRFGGNGPELPYSPFKGGSKEFDK